MTNEADAGRPPGADESPAAQGQPEPAAADGSARRRSPDFKRELLGRLPTLTATQWQASETLNVYQELQGIVDLDADAFLLPLAAVAEERHE